MSEFQLLSDEARDFNDLLRAYEADSAIDEWVESPWYVRLWHWVVSAW
jgi:hypothetical protein